MPDLFGPASAGPHKQGGSPKLRNGSLHCCWGYATTLSATATEVLQISMEQICKPPYICGEIKRNDPLFIDDFLILHSLLRMANSYSIFEIGTCTGEGTLIIKNAVGDHTVSSLELPIGESSYDLQKIGEACYLPYTQIIGNSLSIDYSPYYPLEAWFIDGAHNYAHVFSDQGYAHRFFYSVNQQPTKCDL